MRQRLAAWIAASLCAVPVCAVPAVAADMAVSAPLPVVAPYNWTGFYLGVNAGGALGRDRTTHNLAAAAGSAEQSNVSPAGIIGGAQAGYNWQLGTWLLLGVETDIDGSGQTSSYTCDASCNPLFATGVHTQKIGWLGTTRVRAGLVTGPILTYFTGGVAYGGVTTNYVETAPGGVASASLSGTKTGWTIGSGVEASLGGNWTGKIEYLYIDLGGRSFSLTGPAFGNEIITTRIHESMFRGGLNYSFNGNGAYVAPVADWRGFYVGGNAGGILGRSPSNYNNTFAGAANINETFELMPRGYLGGAEAGYNWQLANWVWGIEADVQGTTAEDKDACVTYCGTFFTSIAYKQTLPWFATARARLGYSFGSTLLYATGGFAYGETRTAITSSVPAISENTITHTKGGYTVGAGIETPLDLLGPNWTAKTEYRYMDLGHSSDVYTLAGGGTQFFASHTVAHIFTAGINYHFNPQITAKN
jgi:outer membrane immunogenic protein